MNQHPSRSSNRLVTLIGLCLLSLTFVGCQSFQPKQPGELALENHGFIGLWDTYNRCLMGSNTDEMRVNLKVLHSAPKPISLDDSPFPVPDFLKELASTRNSRLAVDPRAMAASCSIRVAEVAQNSGDWQTSQEAFRYTVKNFPEPQYAFYVTKAAQALEQFSAVQPVSVSSPNFAR